MVVLTDIVLVLKLQKINKTENRVQPVDKKQKPIGLHPYLLRLQTKGSHILPNRSAVAKLKFSVYPFALAAHNI